MDSRSTLLEYHLPDRSSVQKLLQYFLPFAIESCKTQNTFILEIVEIYKSLVAISKHVIFTWIPSHIHGNTVVDQEAKNTLDDPVSNCSIPYTDFKTFYHEIYFKTLARLGTSVSTSNKTDRHDITEILLKVALITITLTLCQLLNI